MREIQRMRRQVGFSLMELMVVMLIILIVSAIAIPSLMDTISDVRLADRPKGAAADAVLLSIDAIRLRARRLHVSGRRLHVATHGQPRARRAWPAASDPITR